MNPMKASELMEELKTRLPDAPVYATEGRDLTIITSVRQNEPQSEDKTVLLIGEVFEPERWGRSRAYRMLVEALHHGEHGRIFSPQVSESPKTPGKFVVNIDGTPMMNFEVWYYCSYPNDELFKQQMNQRGRFGNPLSIRSGSQIQSLLFQNERPDNVFPRSPARQE